MKLTAYKNSDKLLVAVDCIILGFDGEELKALLIKRNFEPEKGKWSLMGGFVGKKESIDDAASRVLHELTGLTNIYMEQLHCFGDPKRDIAGRVVSVAYFALINLNEYSQQINEDHEARWFPITKLPALIFDHKTMINKAQERLQQKVANQPIGFELLPDKFTLPQLRHLYQAIYNTSFDKRNFTKKILSLGVLKKLAEKDRASSKKGAFYYKFDKIKYRKLAHEGVEFL